jgi:hypothetical protein
MLATLRRQRVVEGAGLRKRREASFPLPEPADAGARRFVPPSFLGGTWDMDPTEKSSPGATSQAQIPEQNRFGWFSRLRGLWGKLSSWASLALD